MVVSDQQKFHLMSCKNPEPAPQPGWCDPNNSGAPHIIYTNSIRPVLWLKLMWQNWLVWLVARSVTTTNCLDSTAADSD